MKVRIWKKLVRHKRHLPKLHCLFLVVLIALRGLTLSQVSGAAENFSSTKEFSNLLSVFRETPLTSGKNHNAETYRIFINPTFYHPLSVSVEKMGNSISLTAKRLSGKGGYEWGELEKERKRELTLDQWNTLTSLIEKASFWSQPVKEKETEPDEKGSVTICLDSTSWTLEGKKPGKYHVVYRYCPESKGIKTIGLYMIKLTKWRVKESDLR